jgi:hypothetical protein
MTNTTTQYPEIEIDCKRSTNDNILFAAEHTIDKDETIVFFLDEDFEEFARVEIEQHKHLKSKESFREWADFALHGFKMVGDTTFEDYVETKEDFTEWAKDDPDAMNVLEQYVNEFINENSKVILDDLKAIKEGKLIENAKRQFQYMFD